MITEGLDGTQRPNVSRYVKSFLYALKVCLVNLELFGCLRGSLVVSKVISFFVSYATLHATLLDGSERKLEEME